MANLRLRSKVLFPATVAGDNGISVTKASGTYTFSWNITGLGQVATVTDTTHTLLPLQNSVSNVANYITFGNFLTQVTGNLTASLASIAALTPAADKVPYYTGASTAALASFTAFGRAVVGVSTLTAHGVMLGQGASAPTVAAPSTAGNLLIDQGASADPVFTALSGDATITSGGVLTVGSHKIGNSKLAQATAWTVRGNPSGSTADVSDFTISGLTQKATPAATDLVMIQDQAAAGAFKYATLSSLASPTVAGVSSFNSRAGAVSPLEADYDSFYVRYDSGAQGLSTASQVNARTNVAAAPYDAIGYFGVQTNGGMEVSQEVSNVTKTFTGGAVTHTNIIDGWACGFGGTMVVTWQQVTDAPPGYPNSLKMAVTTAQGSLAAGDVIVLVEGIEGTRLARLAWGTANAQPLAVGFWVKAHRTGTYSGTFKNPAGTRSFVFSYTVNVADTWEWKTVSITGETSGVWVTDAGVGGFFTLCIGSGTTLLAPGTGWNSGNYDGLTGTTNAVAATSDTFQATGIIIVPGLQLPDQSRAPFTMRPFHEELRLCSRYWQSSYDYGTTPGSGQRNGDAYIGFASGATNTAFGATERFAVVMRSAPTITFYSPVSGLTTRAYDIAASGDTAPGSAIVRDIAGMKGFGWLISGVSNTNAQYAVHWVANSRYF